MDCDICGRTMVLSIEADQSITARCEQCVAHGDRKCWPRCAACRIEALTGFNMGKVARLSADEMIAMLWFFEDGDICWRSVDGRQLVVIPGSGREAYGLLVDEKGWCKRRQ